MLSTQLLQHYPPAVLKSANTLWLLRYRPDEIPFLRDNFGVPEVTLRRFLKMPEGAAPDGSGVPVLAVFRVKRHAGPDPEIHPRSTGAVGTELLS